MKLFENLTFQSGVIYNISSSIDLKPTGTADVDVIKEKTSCCTKAQVKKSSTKVTCAV
jgi:hypothetical protein